MPVNLTIQPDYKRGLAQQSNRQSQRPDGATPNEHRRLGISQLVAGDVKKPFKPSLNVDHRSTVLKFAAPPPALKPLPPRNLKIVAGKIRRSREQQINHDRQKLPDEILVRIVELIEEELPKRGLDITALRTIQSMSGLNASLRYLVGQEEDWQRRLSMMGLGASSFVVLWSLADVDGMRDGRALSTVRASPQPSRTVRHICRHGPGPALTEALGAAECPACAYALRKTKAAKPIKTPEQVKAENIRLRLTHVHAHLWPVGGKEEPVFFDTAATMKLRAAAKSALIAAEQGKKTRYCASDRIGAHPPILHAFATQPPVTSLTVGRIASFDDRVEDYDEHGDLIGPAMTVENDMGVTILDLLASWFDYISHAEYELEEQLEEASATINVWRPFRHGSTLIVPNIEGSEDKDEYLEFE